ncbi:MAG: fumarylacetoacetate hydrolase family protein [Gammaproteobacteria bacterium]|nr:fumarylacetoacetate hydrolase family protein [Gammaproteobacteria bacterium]MBU1724710.1 fumarylacetoacetate hydrolase family protein [Gammaproteobacteria bacterium]MBU2005476.1 fumarylacetoacetate hydrolase family protein [Gammaproteobacteria bacterium]
MARWVRFAADGATRFGLWEGDTIAEYTGDMFDAPQASGQAFAVADVRVLTPCEPSKMIGLWNNFHERAVLEKLHKPEHPLYFLKPANSFAGEGEPILRPTGYSGMVVFEGELGIVIGKTCRNVSLEDAPGYIFGYTCVNDVTARDMLKLDPAFVHWSRAKGSDNFGVFGPCIATGLDPQQLFVRVELNGEEKQNYPVADMFFSPDEIVSRISHDMTLEVGDVIACGTSVGVCGMQDGDTVVVSIEGVGELTNRFG